MEKVDAALDSLWQHQYQIWDNTPKVFSVFFVVVHICKLDENHCWGTVRIDMQNVSQFNWKCSIMGVHWICSDKFWATYKTIWQYLFKPHSLTVMDCGFSSPKRRELPALSAQPHYLWFVMFNLNWCNKWHKNHTKRTSSEWSNM